MYYSFIRLDSITKEDFEHVLVFSFNSLFFLLLLISFNRLNCLQMHNKCMVFLNFEIFENRISSLNSYYDHLTFLNNFI